MLDFGEAVRRYYGNYLNPEGRSQRSAFWWVILFELIINAVLMTVLLMSDGGLELIQTIWNYMVGGGSDDFPISELDIGTSGVFAIVLMFLFGVINILPGIMLRIRRFHDLGVTGWMYLVFLILGVLPFISTLSGLANLFWFCFPGTQGPNKFGQDPLGDQPDIFG